jgi:hypothetical protein
MIDGRQEAVQDVGIFKQIADFWSAQLNNEKLDVL